MAGEEEFTDRNNGIECRICEDLFTLQGNKVPRLLTCGHSLCHDCLTRLPVNGLILSCPFDRQQTKLGDSGIWGLMKNFSLLELLERLHAKKSEIRHDKSPNKLNAVACEEEASHIASTYCTICETNLCQNCFLATHSSRTLSKHKHVPLSERPYLSPCCPLHQHHVLEFVCLEESCSDDKLMCYICKDYGRHQGHKHVLLADDAECVRSSVSKAMQHMSLFSTKILEFASRLSSVIEKIEGGNSNQIQDNGEVFTGSYSTGTAEIVRSQVYSYFNDLRETIDRQEEAGLAVVDNHIREKLCFLRQHQEDVAVLMHQVSTTTQECELATRKSDADVIKSKKNILDLLDKVEQKQREFSCMVKLFRDDAAIPITFTKDNRVHVGPKLEMRVVALGLDNAGKTSILFKLKQDEFVSPITTIGFNVETVENKALKFTIWDVGGVQKLRPLWRHYYLNTQAIIFVVDSTNQERLTEAKEELAKLLAEKRLEDALLLIFANKQDLPNALHVDRVSESLGLQRLCCGRSWNILGTDAHSGRGLQEGLDWLARQLMSEFES